MTLIYRRGGKYCTFVDVKDPHKWPVTNAQREIDNINAVHCIFVN